jgi:DNA-binding NtrC family response regulator
MARPGQIKILIVEDDRLYSRKCSNYLKTFGEVTSAYTFSEAEQILNQSKYELVLVDVNLDVTKSGVKLIPIAKKNGAHVITLSNVEDSDVIKDAYQSGCDHFIIKEHTFKSLEPYLNHFCKNLFQNVIHDFFKHQFITQDEGLIERITDLLKKNLNGQNVLMTGETGVGKTYLAKLIHQMNNLNGQFIQLNCSEIPEDLIESELFGHTKGAFTGAQKDKKGKLQLADGGTLFLDEIATMPLPMQQKLLKAIDEKCFYPLGSNTPVNTDFSLISATCESLIEKIENNKFRKDFYFRISGHHIQITSLRNRIGDLEILAYQFLKKLPRKFFIEEDVFESMKKYPWPGNVRELHKVLMLFSQNVSGIIKKKDFSAYKQGQPIGLKGYTSEPDQLTQEQLHFIYKNGLRTFFKKIEKQVIEDLYINKNKSVTECMAKLQLSASSTYRIIKENITEQ